MTDRERRIAFAVCAVIIAAVVALLSLTRPAKPPAPPAPPPSVSVPVVPPKGTPVPVTADDDTPPAQEAPTGALPAGEPPEAGARPPRGGPGGPPAVAAAARRFLDAYLVYELGRPDAAQRRAIARTTGEPLRSQLLDDPPRAPLGARLRPARLLWIDSVTPFRRGGASGYEVWCVLGQGGAREMHLVTVTKEAGRWLATDLRA